MSVKKLCVLLGAFVIFFAAFSPTSTAGAATDVVSVSGTVYTINLATRSITVKKADATLVTLKVNRASTLKRNGKQVKLKALMLQDQVNARYKSNRVATSLNATGPKAKSVSGKLNDALKGSGTVTIGGKTVHTTARTRISRNGKLTSLSSLTRRDILVAHVRANPLASSDKGEASDLIAEGPEDDEVHGAISAIAGSQVTITPSNGTADLTLNVTDKTMIEVNGEHAALGDLAIGMQVEAAFDPATLNAYSIEADSEGEQDDAHISGAVTAVDVGAGTLTLAPAAGDPVTLNVEASTEIEVNDVHGTLADIQVGMPARAEYDTATLLAKEIKAGEGDEDQEDAKIEGTVAAVDVGAQTIAITPSGGGADVTLQVTTETEIQVNDENGTLADIAVGVAIRAEFNPATLKAFELKVGSEDDGDGDHEGEEAEITGTVSAVDTTNATVRIAPTEGDPVTLNITEQTEIKVNGEDATLADVTVGENVKAHYDPGTLEARELEVGEHEGEGN